MKCLYPLLVAAALTAGCFSLPDVSQSAGSDADNAPTTEKKAVYVRIIRHSGYHAVEVENKSGKEISLPLADRFAVWEVGSWFNFTVDGRKVTYPWVPSVERIGNRWKDETHKALQPGAKIAFAQLVLANLSDLETLDTGDKTYVSAFKTPGTYKIKAMASYKWGTDIEFVSIPYEFKLD